jgi:hypothetical protein
MKISVINAERNGPCQLACEESSSLCVAGVASPQLWYRSKNSAGGTGAGGVAGEENEIININGL